jgi:hypothetical protein
MNLLYLFCLKVDEIVGLAFLVGESDGSLSDECTRYVLVPDEMLSCERRSGRRLSGSAGVGLLLSLPVPSLSSEVPLSCCLSSSGSVSMKLMFCGAMSSSPGAGTKE